MLTCNIGSEIVDVPPEIVVGRQFCRLKLSLQFGIEILKTAKLGVGRSLDDWLR